MERHREEVIALFNAGAFTVLRRSYCLLYPAVLLIGMLLRSHLPASSAGVESERVTGTD